MPTTNVMKSNKGRILFVEDERNLVDLYHIYFEKKGYDFLSTADIQEALKLTEFEQPDVVLLDLIIPKLENGIINVIAEQGYDYLEAVKKNPKTKDVPIIVYTNLDTPQDRVKCSEMGAASYVFKGRALPQEVLDTVSYVIEQDRKKKKK